MEFKAKIGSLKYFSESFLDERLRAQNFYMKSAKIEWNS